MLFTGSYTALLTPFKNGEVDYDAYRKLVDFQIDNGTHGLVPVGTTGESPTLSHDEHKKVIEVCIDQANGRVPIIAGAGSNSTAEAIEFVKHACDVGADGLLVERIKKGEKCKQYRCYTNWLSWSQGTSQCHTQTCN